MESSFTGTVAGNRHYSIGTIEEPLPYLRHFSYPRNVGRLPERFHVGAAIPGFNERGDILLRCFLDVHHGVIHPVPLRVLVGGVSSLVEPGGGWGGGEEGRLVSRVTSRIEPGVAGGGEEGRGVEILDSG